MKKIYYILTFLLCVYVQAANAQMGVNSTGAVPAADAMLDVRSTNKGFLMPRMTTTQRNAISVVSSGLMIYNTTTNEIEVFRGLAGWVAASRMAVPFVVSGSNTGGIIQSSNSGTGTGVQGNATSGTGVVGVSTSGVGVLGSGDQGVYGSGINTGVYGTTTGGTGIYGESNTNRGVWGRGLTTGDGVYGDATSGTGVFGLATTGLGVVGQNNSTINAAGAFNNTSTSVSAKTTRIDGVNGTGETITMTGTGRGLYSQTNDGAAGEFNATSSGFGVNAYSNTGIAVYGSNSTNSATAPVAQFLNLSGGTALEVVASTAIKIQGAIKVAGGNFAPAFKITTNTAGGGNTSGNILTIPNTTLANNINDILIVTHNYSPNNTYLNKAYGVFWSALSNSWNIYLEDVTAMPNNITFNVLVIKQ